jgi:hypothetical protein
MRRSLLRLAEHASHHARPAGGVGSAPHIHEAAPFYRYSAIALGATTWFWILYNAKNEGAVLLVSSPPVLPSCVRTYRILLWDGD